MDNENDLGFEYLKNELETIRNMIEKVRNMNFSVSEPNEIGKIIEEIYALKIFVFELSYALSDKGAEFKELKEKLQKSKGVRA